MTYISPLSVKRYHRKGFTHHNPPTIKKEDLKPKDKFTNHERMELKKAYREARQRNERE